MDQIFASNGFPPPDRWQPSFFRFPIQNDRTGWKPVWTPTVLVVPWYRDGFGNVINCSSVNRVTFSIEETSVTPVAGHVYGPHDVGIYNPDLNIYSVTLTDEPITIPPSMGRQDRLYPHTISLESEATFFRGDQEIPITDAVSGDYFRYTLSRGTVGFVTYYSDALYYDLSSIEIDVTELPENRYNFVWQTEYSRRINDGDRFICVNCDEISISRLVYPINHPGEIHADMIHKTPSIYFNDVKLSSDTTIELYRPIADVLQDIFDEQTFVRGINWVHTIPSQYLPYLAYLINIDLPYFNNIDPDRNDKIRRRMIERGANIQKLKGSRRAIIELFNIFNFIVDFVKLYSSRDGKRFIAPNESLPAAYTDEEITSKEVCQTDPIVLKYADDGFGEIEIPLLYMNKEKDIQINAFLIKDGSDADSVFSTITNNFDNPDAFVDETCAYDRYGNIIPCSLFGSIAGGNVNEFCNNGTDVTGGFCSRNVGEFPDGVIGYSYLVLTDIELLNEEHYGDSLFRPNPYVGPRRTQTNIRYDRLSNLINMTFPSYRIFDGVSAYIFVTYKRDMIMVPDILKSPVDLRSNRFDLYITERDETAIDDSNLYEYLVTSLFKFKAFHSLLRKIIYTRRFFDVYNVTDFCSSGNVVNKYVNELQTPPSISAESTGEYDCGEVLNRTKTSDQILKNNILSALEEEYQAWRDVLIGQNGDYKHEVPATSRDALQFKSAIQIPYKDYEDAYNYRGQDRITEYMVMRDFEGRGALSIGETRRFLVSSSAVNDITIQSQDTDLITLRTAQMQGVIINPIPVGYSIKVTVERIIGGDMYYVHVDPFDYNIAQCDCTEQYESQHVNDIRSKVTNINAAVVPEYCYKGRVQDDLRSQLPIDMGEKYRCNPCANMGDGIYYSLKYDTSIRPDCWPALDDESVLQYNDRDWFNTVPSDAYDIPSLGIFKPDMAIPGYRFISLGHLSEDFSHPDYNARPWDFSNENDRYTSPSVGRCVCIPTLNNPLNARIINRVEPDECGGESNTEYLEYDITTLTYDADGITPDIDLDNNIGDDVHMAREVYTAVVDSPYVFLSSMRHSNDAFINIDSPIFESASECDCAFRDYIDGYTVGESDFTDYLSNYWAARECVSGGYLIEPSVPDDEYTFKTLLSSFIASDKCVFNGKRLDCGCLSAPCDDNNCGCEFGTCIDSTEPSPECDIYLNDDTFDTECDEIEINRILKLGEVFGSSCIQLDGSMGLSELFGSGTSEDDVLEYVDTYGVQYRIQSEVSYREVDEPPPGCVGCVIPEDHGLITIKDTTVRVEMFDPRVWGEQPNGYVDDNDVYRQGILTVSKYISTVWPDGKIFVEFDEPWRPGCQDNQCVAYRRTNLSCSPITECQPCIDADNECGDDRKYLICNDMGGGAFDHDLHNEVCDDIEMGVTYGPHWTYPGEDGPGWDDPSGGTDVTFEFIDVWHCVQPGTEIHYVVGSVGVLGASNIDDSTECCEYDPPVPVICCWKWYLGQWWPVWKWE